MTVNYLSMSYMLLFAPCNIISVIVFDKYGLKMGITLGIVMTTIGLWIRCLASYSFWFVIVG